jgi:MoxR-like ATPase
MTRRAKPDADFVAVQAARMHALLRERAAVPREDLEYLVERIARLRDERLQAAVAGLIGWGDEERAEIETFVAIAVEVMRQTSVSRLRAAARTVELRYYAREMQQENA